MITSNVIQRTFHIRVGDSSSTCFTIDVADKQYIITAKHVVSGISGTQKISMFHGDQWKDIDVTLVGHCDGEIDISVLATNVLLSPNHPLQATTEGIIYGQDIYFLGFPYDMTGDIGEINRDFPLPFVRHAILSCLYTTPAGSQLLFLEGHNNPGFSGGRVVFKEPNKHDFKVAGVISGYRYNEEPIYQGAQQLPLAYRYNTGIIITYGIQHAIELIESNPVELSINT